MSKWENEGKIQWVVKGDMREREIHIDRKREKRGKTAREYKRREECKERTRDWRKI